MSRATYRFNSEKHKAHGGNMTECSEEDPCMERIDEPVEWVINGVRYGSDALAEMKRNGWVPPSDFKEHWEKAAAERERLYHLGNGDTRYVRRDENLRQQISDAIEAVKAGYGVRGKRG